MTLRAAHYDTDNLEAAGAAVVPVDIGDRWPERGEVDAVVVAGRRCSRLNNTSG